MVTPADTLRRAAALMRQRAEAATHGAHGDWAVYEQSADLSVVAAALDPTGQFDDSHEYVLDNPTAMEQDLIHIASWGPAVALAAADWLEQVDRDHDAIDPHVTSRILACKTCGEYELADEDGTVYADAQAVMHQYPCATRARAEAFARAYLGEVTDGD
jgi:hypothetical protein